MKFPKKFLSVTFFIFLLLFADFSIAESDLAPLPDPLSLEDALKFIDQPHPDVSFQEYSVSIARDQLKQIDSVNDLEIKAKAEARFIEPPEPLENLGHEDHRAVIAASKTLYDFGRTGNKKLAAQQTLQKTELELEQVVQLRRLEIMQAFFNVILADLQFNYDNEAMAMYFIYYDRAKERQELGQLSDIDVLEKQSEYMEVRRNRFRSESQKRTARVAMSLVLDRPAQIISRFEPPKLNYSKYKLSELTKLQAEALEKNLDLQILRHKSEQALATMKSLRANRLPVLNATAEAGVYSREIGGNDAWRLGVGVEIPLYQGGRVDSAIAEQQSRLDQLRLEIYQTEQAIKQEALALWMDIDVLTKQSESTNVEMDYRELYLDRARSLYEMEVKTNLGDSMIALSKAAKYAAETEFAIAMKWERLRYITQMNLEDMHQ